MPRMRARYLEQAWARQISVPVTAHGQPTGRVCDRYQNKPEGCGVSSQLALLDRGWISANMGTVLDHFRGKEFCADDLHGLLPEPENRNYFGVLMAKLSQAKKIKRIGSVPSQRPGRNGSWIGVYVVL